MPFFFAEVNAETNAPAIPDAGIIARTAGSITQIGSRAAKTVAINTDISESISISTAVSESIADAGVPRLLATAISRRDRCL